MEQQQYEEQRHFRGVADSYHQPSFLNMPPIKVEPELGTNRCETSHYSNNDSNSNSFGHDFSSSSTVCNPPCNKNVPTQPNSSRNYCNEVTIVHANLHDNSYGQQEHVQSPQQPSSEVSNTIPCLDRPGFPQRYPPINTGNQLPFPQDKCRPPIASPWFPLPRQNERPQPLAQQEGKQQYHLPNKECAEKSETLVKNGESDESATKQAYDLTCRSRSPLKDQESSMASLFPISEPPLNQEQTSSSQPRNIPKSQTCKICGKILSSPSSYYVHMKLHSGNKPYACTICEASFCRKPYLEVHMRTHTGERPFECDMCYKRFTQKSSLNTHKRVHTGERPYSCDICQKTFAVKSYVTAHRWSHVSEKPLECQHCGVSFTSKNLFALHIRTHTDRSHECLECGRTFMKDSYLIRHQNRVHSDRSIMPADTHERSPSRSPRSSSASPENSASAFTGSAVEENSSD